MDNHTTQLAEGVWLVEVAWFTNVLVVANDGRSDREGLTLVDTGPAAGGPRLVRSLRMLGFDPRAVGDVLLSHWHVAAAGAAARFATSSAAPRVWCAPGDLEVVQGAAPPAPRTAPRLRRLTRTLTGRPTPVPDARAVAEHPAAVPAAADPPPGTVVLAGIGGGLHVVAADGHTAGHSAVHLPSRGVLHTADALSTVGGLRPSPAWLAERPEQQAATLRRLAGLDFEVLSVGHGPPLLAATSRDHPAARLGRLAAEADG